MSSARSDALLHDLDGALGPGLINAHAHLDLSVLAGRVSHRRGFVPWIGSLMGERGKSTAAEQLTAAARGVAALLRSGVTAVGDIDTLGLSSAALAGSPMRAVLFREVLDGDIPGRAAIAHEALQAALAQPTGADDCRRGISPHAPYTVSSELLDRVAACASERPVQIHWSETDEEVEWLAQGTGPFSELLSRSTGRGSSLPGRGPGQGHGQGQGQGQGHGQGLAKIAASGLLKRGTSLVHGNLPAPGEPEQLAAAGVPLVHCPGTHAFFGRRPFPWRRYLDAGVTLALGTDSLASNDLLDLGLEMSRVRESLPQARPEEVFAAATCGGAEVLGLAGRVARIDPNFAADLVHVGLDVTRTGEVLDAWTASHPPVLQVWIAGVLAVGAALD